MNELVSIIIPVFNGEKTIERAIESCLNQSYQNIEIIIIDNASTDTTAELIKLFNSPKLTYLYTEKKGRSLARNIGLKYANGMFIQFLDADDILYEDKIMHSLKIFENNVELQGVSVGIDYVDTSDRLLKTLFPKMRYRKNLLEHNIFPIHSLLIKKNVATSFPEDLDYCEDWVFWAKSLWGKSLYHDMGFVGGAVYIHKNNTMLDREKMSEYELIVTFRLKEQYGMKNIYLFKGELTKLIIHYFNPQKNELAVQSISENARFLYFCVKFMCGIPVIKTKLKDKVKRTIDKNLY